MKGRIEIGAAVGEVFATYLDNAGVLLLVSFLLYAVAAAVEAVSHEYVALGVLAAALYVIVPTLLQGMIAGLVQDVRAGRAERSAGDLLRWVAPVLWTLIGAGLLAFLGIVLGLVLLVIPGLIALTLWAVIAPVIVIERTGVFEAFKRSSRLVGGRSNGWRVFATLLVIGLIVALVVAGLIAIFLVIGLVLDGEGIVDGQVTSAVFSALISAVTAPVAGLVTAVLYFRLREIEDAAPATGDPVPSGDPGEALPPVP